MVYKVFYIDRWEQIIDQTEIDENDEEFAKELYVEFGHSLDDLQEIKIEEYEEEEVY